MIRNWFAWRPVKLSRVEDDPRYRYPRIVSTGRMAWLRWVCRVRTEWGDTFYTEQRT